MKQGLVQLYDCLGEQGVIWFSNFEVERFWRNQAALSLPMIDNKNSTLITNSLSELGLLLAREEDIVLVYQAPDPDFLGYLTELGWKKPKIVALSSVSDDTVLTESLLQDQNLLSALQPYMKNKSYVLYPHGTSYLEEQLAKKLHVPLATAGSDITAKVNSKVYSRTLAERKQIKQVLGGTAQNLDDLKYLFNQLKQILNRNPLVLKDSMGVSGKGMLVIENEQRFYQIFNLLHLKANKEMSYNVDFVLEEWIPRAKDLNYQFFITPSGTFAPLSIFEARVTKGSHNGHISPHSLHQSMVEQLTETGEIISTELVKENYHGLFGVDAMIGTDGELYPCIEINARMNMSTYLLRIISEWLPEKKTLISRTFGINKKGTLSFAQVKAKLREELFTKEKGVGVLIFTWGAVNVNARNDEGNYGRVYALIVGNDLQDAQQREEKFFENLKAFPGVTMVK